MRQRHPLLGGSDANLIARAHGEIGLTTHAGSIWVDAKVWPPQIVRRPEQTLAAARGPTGAWLAYVRSPGRPWRLRWYDALATNVPAREAPEPAEIRDIARLGDLIDALADARAGELADATKLESVHLLGDRAVVVPRHVGLGEHRHPFIAGAAGERWREATELPPFAKTAAHHRDRCTCACLRLHDGSDVLVWDGHVFALDGDALVRRFAHRLALRWFDDHAPLPFGAAGLVACDRGQLVELGADGVVAHLPGVIARGVRRGPGETLVIATRSVPLLWSPDEDWVCELPPELLGRRGEVVGALPGGDLVAYDARGVDLTRIPASELAALPRRRASGAVVIARPPGQPALDDVGAAARTQIAGAGEHVVVCSGGALRFHLGERAIGSEQWAEPIVAVAHDGRHPVALDASGTLRVRRAEREGGDLVCHVAGVPRALVAGPDATWLVVVAHGAWRVDFRALARRGAAPEPIRFLGAFTAAVDPAGTVLLLGERGRVATCRADGGDVLELPTPIEPLVACAALGAGRFACAGERHLFELDLADGELALLPLGGEPAATRTPYLAVAPGGALIAWAPTPTTISIAAVAPGAVIERALFPPEYSQPLDTPLTVRGLAFTDARTLAVALDGGRGVLLDLAERTARRLEPQIGDDASRWIFHFAGKLWLA